MICCMIGRDGGKNSREFLSNLRGDSFLCLAARQLHFFFRESWTQTVLNTGKREKSFQDIRDYIWPTMVERGAPA